MRKWGFLLFTCRAKNTHRCFHWLGNSHLYTGINPQNLSNSLGCNAFIIASPGTFVVDHYFAIKEAIGVHQPKLIVLETYGLRKCNPYHFNETGLSSQLKSFLGLEEISC